MLATSYVPYEARNWQLCIDTYADGEIAGRLYGSAEQKALRFCSALPMLRMMETLIDREQMVQRNEQGRTFRPRQTSGGGEPNWRELERRPGAAATFTVCIHFRQNATWQGEVVWLERQQRTCFRSALELLFLLDSALAGMQDGAVPCSG